MILAKRISLSRLASGTWHVSCLVNGNMRQRSQHNFHRKTVPAKGTTLRRYDSTPLRGNAGGRARALPPPPRSHGVQYDRTTTRIINQRMDGGTNERAQNWFVSGWPLEKRRSHSGGRGNRRCELGQKRFDEFTAEHLAYTGAHGEVQAAVTLLRERLPALRRRNRTQDELLEDLAGRLANDGHTPNPVAAYGVAAPSAVMKLSYGEKAQTIHTLVGMVQEDPAASLATRGTATALEEAARQMEADLIPYTKLQARRRTARSARTAAGKRWDTALNALKIAAHAAAADGAPGLYDALFGDLTHPKKKMAKAGTQQTTDKAATPAAAGAEVKTS